MSRYPLAFQSGGSPLTPRIAVWRKDPELCLGSFFIVPSTAWRRFEDLPRVTDRRGKSFLRSACRMEGLRPVPVHGRAIAAAIFGDWSPARDTTAVFPTRCGWRGNPRLG